MKSELQWKAVGVINPRSCGGATGRNADGLKAHLESTTCRALSSVSWKITASKGDATAITRDALEKGAELIISVGGDGTHNEVVSGFFDSSSRPVNKDAVLAIVHRGTGGDLRRSLGLPTDPWRTPLEISATKVRKLDIGLAEYVDNSGNKRSSLFANIASVGISGQVDYHVEHTRLRRLGGTVAFAAATLQSFFSHQNRPLRIRIDGGDMEEHLSVCTAVANGVYFGGGMKIAPMALLNDGAFDVVCLGDFSMLDFLTKAHRLYAGTHLDLDKVWHRRARHVEIESDHPVLLDIDGEAPGRLPVTIRVLEAALNVITGPGAALSRSQAVHIPSTPASSGQTSH